MEYLDKVLGVKVIYEDVEFKYLPNFIATRYRLRMVSMNEQKIIFLYPKAELEQIEVLKKHIARIQKNENLPVVLVLKALSFRQKEYLIREKIPFIVEGSQFGIGADRAVNYQCDSEGTALNYEVVSEAISSVRCSAPLSADWKKRIDEDYKKRGGRKRK